MRSSENEFIAEAEEILQDAGNLLLQIQESAEGQYSPDLVNALFRAMHTLKGMSGLFGFQDVTDISHAVESLLDDLRLGRTTMSQDVIAFLFKSIDVLRSLVNGLKNKSMKEAEKVPAFLQEIALFREAVASTEESAECEVCIDEDLMKVLSQYEEHRMKTNIKDGKGIYMVRAVFSIMEFDTLLKDLIESIKTYGELISTMPTSESIQDGFIGFNLMVGSNLSAVKIKNSAGFNVETLVKPGAAMKEGEAGTAVVPSSQGETAPVAEGRIEKSTEVQASIAEMSLKTSSTSVRVDIEKLDRILSTISELSLVKHTLNTLWEELTESQGHTPQMINLYRVVQSFQRRLAELQGQVLDIRMVPVGQIFQRLSQVVRRYSRSVGKKIDLQVFGEDTEIDKALAEEIIDPLVHLVRNAIDHGIETADERHNAGKAETACIKLRAYQYGNSVHIEVIDDGGGVDKQKVVERARAAGLVHEGDDPGENEIFDLLFTPGLSTTDEVSETSGRGVGLDIVRDRVIALGGSIEVQSELGSGAKFTLTCPVTVAIVRALILRVGNERFALPLSSMSETIVVERKAMQRIEGREVCKLRDEMLPLRRLGDFFSIQHDRADRLFAVVVGHGDRRMGILVDELVEQYDVVIKSLGGYFEELHGFAGAAEVGEFDTILVIDVEAFIEDTLLQKGTASV